MVIQIIAKQSNYQKTATAVCLTGLRKSVPLALTSSNPNPTQYAVVTLVNAGVTM